LGNSLRRLAFEARVVGLFDLRRCLRGLCFFLLALDLLAATLGFRFLLGFEPTRLFFRRFARRVFTSDPLSFYFRLGSDRPSLLRSFRNRPLSVIGRRVGPLHVRTALANFDRNGAAFALTSFQRADRLARQR